MYFYSISQCINGVEPEIPLISKSVEPNLKRFIDLPLSSTRSG